MDDTGPGLSIALGGLGISLEELVARYTALANGGVFKELSLSKFSKSRSSFQLFDTKSSEAVLNILRQTEAPEGRYIGQQLGKLPSRPELHQVIVMW